jgi:hypothetical protein
MSSHQIPADAVLRRTTEGQRTVITGFGDLEPEAAHLLLVANGYTPLNAFPGGAAHPFDETDVATLLDSGLLELAPEPAPSRTASEG